MGKELFSDVKQILNMLRICVEKNSDLKDFTRNIDRLLKITQKSFNIMIIGEFSTGKSSFINALIGKNVAVVNVIPTTAVITKFSYGESDEVIVHFHDGSSRNLSPKYFTELTSETEENSKIMHSKISFIERKISAEFLDSINIIDSPGLNSLEKDHENITRKFVSAADIIVWVFDVERAVTKSEVDSFKKISPDLNFKPIIVVNKMDNIDEDEGDNPENILEEIRKRLVNNKIEFQCLIGVSAELALEGEAQNDKNLVEESNIQKFCDVVNEIIERDIELYKKISILNELSEFIFDFGNFLGKEHSDNVNNRNENYPLYIQNETNFAESADIFEFLVHFIAEYFQENELDFELRVVRQTFSGVIEWLAQLKERNRSYYPDELENAAIRNDETTKRILIKIFQILGENEKADYWKNKLKVRDSEKVSITNQKSEVNWQPNITLEDLAKKYSAKVFNLVKKYKTRMNGTGTGQIFAIYKDEKFFEISFDFFFKSTDGRYLKVVSKEFEKHSKYDLAKEEWEELKNLKKICFDFSYPDEKNSVAGLKIFRAEDSVQNNGNVNRKRKFIPQENSQAKNDSHEMYSDEYVKGKKCEDDGDYISAVYWYKKAADSGNGLAMISLGNLYASGKSVEKNYTEAIKWYKKSAEAGYEDAKAKILEVIREKANINK